MTIEQTFEKLSLISESAGDTSGRFTFSKVISLLNLRYTFKVSSKSAQSHLYGQFTTEYTIQIQI